MYDTLIKLDLDLIKQNNKFPSYVVFHDGRVVLADDFGHGQTVIRTCRQYYPEWAEKFNRMVKERFGDFDDDMDDDEKERYSCMMVLNNEYLERNGFVVLHNEGVLGLLIFGYPSMTTAQVDALNKINEVFPIDDWPKMYEGRCF